MLRSNCVKLQNNVQQKYLFLFQKIARKKKEALLFTTLVFLGNDTII